LSKTVGRFNTKRAQPCISSSGLKLNLIAGRKIAKLLGEFRQLRPMKEIVPTVGSFYEAESLIEPDDPPV